MPILACPYEGNEPVTLYCVKKMSENAGQEGGGSCSQPEGWIRSAHAECPQLDPPGLHLPRGAQLCQALAPHNANGLC